MAILESEDRKQELIARLKRVEGQVRGVQIMIQNGVDSDKVAQQLTASRKALDRAFHHLMANVIAQEMNPDGKLNNDALARLERMTNLLAKFS